MAIDTLSGYIPTYTLPVYTKIVKPHHNDYKVGEEYEMRIQDEERAKEKGELGDFSYVHESILVSKEKMMYGDVHPLIIALSGYDKSRTEAEKKIIPGDRDWGDLTEVLVLTFIRKDAAKEFIEMNLGADGSWVTKENYE